MNQNQPAILSRDRYILAEILSSLMELALNPLLSSFLTGIFWGYLDGLLNSFGKIADMPSIGYTDMIYQYVPHKAVAEVSKIGNL